MVRLLYYLHLEAMNETTDSPNSTAWHIRQDLDYAPLSFEWITWRSNEIELFEEFREALLNPRGFLVGLEA